MTPFFFLNCVYIKFPLTNYYTKLMCTVLIVRILVYVMGRKSLEEAPCYQEPS